jgi:glycosyltransferase involved in cell wall biosynthesis
VPDVSKDLRRTAWVVEEYGAGWTAAPEPRALADRCLEVIGDRELLAETGRRARSVAEGALSWPRLADHVLSSYSSLL